MSHRISARAISSLCVVLMIAAPLPLPGCIGPPADPGLSLSADRIIPGGFLAVRHHSILKGDAVRVRFRAPDGFHVAVDTTATADGETRVAVPPYVNPTFGFLDMADVRVSVDGIDGERTLFIGNPPSLPGWQRGELLRAMFDFAIEQLDAAAANTAALDLLFPGTNADATVQDIMNARAEMQAASDELKQFGRLQIDVDGRRTFLTGDRLDTVERVLAGMLLGATEEMQFRDGAAKTVNTMQLIPVDDPNFQKIFPPEALQGFKDAAENIRNAPLVLIGVVSTGAGLVALFAGAELAAAATVTGVVLTAGGAIHTLTSGVLLSQSSKALLGEDPSGFDVAQESLRQAVNQGISFLGGIPGRIGQLITAATTALSAVDTYNGMKDIKCESVKSDRNRQLSSIEFCSTLAGGAPGGDPGGVPAAGCDGNGAFRVLEFKNVDDRTEADGVPPDICLTGSDPTRPQLSWKTDGSLGGPVHIASIRAMEPEVEAGYAIATTLAAGTGGLQPPLTYADYSPANTTRFVGAPFPQPLCGAGRVYEATITVARAGELVGAANLVFEQRTPAACDDQTACRDLVGEFESDCSARSAFHDPTLPECTLLAQDICPDGVRGCDIGSFIQLSHQNFPAAKKSICTDPFESLVTLTGTRARMVITWDEDKVPDVSEVVVLVENAVVASYGLRADDLPDEGVSIVPISPRVVYGDPPPHSSMTVRGDAPGISIGDEVFVRLVDFNSQFIVEATFQAK